MSKPKELTEEAIATASYNAASYHPADCTSSCLGGTRRFCEGPSMSLVSYPFFKFRRLAAQKMQCIFRHSLSASAAILHVRGFTSYATERAPGMTRRHWLLVGACGWVLLILLFVSKLVNINDKSADDYSGKSEMPSWTGSSSKTTQPLLQTKKTEAALSLTSSTANLSEWRSVIESRSEFLSAVCKNSSLLNLTHTPVRKFVLDRIFVCDKHKILFCQTPKVGNTQWKKVLIVLNGVFKKLEEIPEDIVHDQARNGLRRLSSMTDEEITERLNSYFKFFIVREPFERIISAFKDKFVNNPRFEPWYKHEIAPVIIRKYRKRHHVSDDIDMEPAGLRFEDFVRYLGDKRGRRLDEQFGSRIIHWLTYTELCAPCDITYDVIGHHETLEWDAPYILKATGIDRLVSYPTIPPGITLFNRTKVEKYFSGISKRDIRRLYARYEGDFSLFGYQRPDYLLD